MSEMNEKDQYSNALQLPHYTITLLQLKNAKYKAVSLGGMKEYTVATESNGFCYSVYNVVCK